MKSGISRIIFLLLPMNGYKLRNIQKIIWIHFHYVNGPYFPSRYEPPQGVAVRQGRIGHIRRLYKYHNAGREHPQRNAVVCGPIMNKSSPVNSYEYSMVMPIRKLLRSHSEIILLLIVSSCQCGEIILCNRSRLCRQARITAVMAYLKAGAPLVVQASSLPSRLIVNG